MVCGTISLVLGVIGLIIPGLPTTPFLLLASFCYMHSSKKMHDWLMGNRILGKYIYNYVHYKAIDKKTKIVTLMFLWCSMATSIYLIENTNIRIFLLFVGIAVSTHILLLKTMKIDSNND